MHCWLRDICILFEFSGNPLPQYKFKVLCLLGVLTRYRGATAAGTQVGNKLLYCRRVSKSEIKIISVGKEIKKRKKLESTFVHVSF